MKKPFPDHARHDLRTTIILAATALTVMLYASQARAEIHPVVHFTSGEEAAVKARLAGEPYASWHVRLNDAADAALASSIDWSGTTVPEETKAWHTRNLAYAWAFADSTEGRADGWLEEALDALSNLPAGNWSERFSSDLAVSEAALYWAESYDILAGDGADFNRTGSSGLEPLVRSRLKALRDYMAQDEYQLFSSGGIANDFPSVSHNGDDAMDNHHVKLNASLAVLSLVIADESGSRADLDHALERLRAGLRTMTVAGEGAAPAGGWVEGPEYHRYSAQQYLTAVVALENTGEAYLYNDIPELAETELTLPLMVMPDGCLPPFDDNHAVIGDMAGLWYSALEGREDRDTLHWLWERSGAVVKNAFLVDYIARFDDTPPVYASPAELGIAPTLFRPDSGFGVFRDAWEDNDLWLFLSSENGEARLNGRAHEHPDPNSIMLYAHGEPLIIDSGYGGWSAHDATRHAENHNLILVNGEGPSSAAQPYGFGTWQANGSDARIDTTRSFTSDRLDHAVSETLYENTSFLRHVVFPGKRFFFIYDDLTAGTQSTFTLLLHGNGGGDSGGSFTAAENGAVWTREGASLHAMTTGTGTDLTFTSRDMQHAVYDRTLKTHTMLEVGQTGKEVKSELSG